MANANVPRGLVPYRRSSGEPYNSAGNIYYVPASQASNIYVGDPLMIVSGAADVNGIPAVTQATPGAGNYIIGAFMGKVVGGNAAAAIPVLRDTPVYEAAGVPGYILVCDDPDALYLVQENGNMGQGAPGRNVNLIAGAGNNQYGWSGWMLNSSTLATTNTLQMRIMRGLNEADNDVTLPNAKWLCRINLNALSNPLGT